MVKIISILAFIITGFGSYGQDRSINIQEKSEAGWGERKYFCVEKTSTNPILLILHGGPGFSEFAYFRTFNRELENKFVVVNWDQRGTHLSYNDSIEGKSMTFDQIVSDAHELISNLKARFGKNKIFLLAHSAGTITGVKYALRYPDLYAYIGVGQVVNGMKNEMESLSYALKMAKRNNNKTAIVELNEVQKKLSFATAEIISIRLHTENGLSIWWSISHKELFRFI